MVNKTQIERIFKALIILVPMVNYVSIKLFLSEKIVSMPADFPYSPGVWCATGVALILLISFLFAFIAFIIARKVSNQKDLT